MDSEATSILTAINLTTHVIVPMEVKDHNASNVTDRTLDWVAVPGQPFEMTVVAGPTGIGGF